MKDEQRSVEVSAAAAARGNPPPPRRKKWRTLQTRLKGLKTQYNSGTRTLMEYWDAVVYAVKVFV